MNSTTTENYPSLIDSVNDNVLTKSPSASSLSSINSNDSTGKLIKSLSTDKIAKQELPKSPPLNNLHSIPSLPSPPQSSLGKDEEEKEKETEKEIGENLSKETDKEKEMGIKQAKPSPISIKKKPIKFTVRKVSHEQIKSPVLESSNNGNRFIFSNSHSNQYSHDYKKVRSSSINSQSKDNSNNKDNDNGKSRVYQQLDLTQMKYDQYASRIIKIDKEVNFLTNLLPPYNVEIDYATRTKIYKAIEKLKMKQDEIEKKKYSLGITISRLWRDLDDSDIWVKSVSNH